MTSGKWYTSRYPHVPTGDFADVRAVRGYVLLCLMVAETIEDRGLAVFEWAAL